MKTEGAWAGGGEGGGGKGAAVATGAEGGSTSVEKLQQMMSVLQKEKEEAQAILEQVQVQNKVDINWYESQLRALENDSLQFVIATSRVRMLQSESEAAQAQGKREVDAIRQELDAAQAALRDEQQARSQQQKEYNDLVRLMTEMEEMGEKYKVQISVLESTLKLYMDEPFLPAGKSKYLLTPSPESIHTRVLSVVEKFAPGQGGRGLGLEDASGVDESGKIVSCRSAEAGKDCGVQCSLDTSPLDSEVELRMKHLEEQNSTLRQTVKDANGIIVKSEALTNDYRCKVFDLTRQLSEVQARLDHMERDANTTLATSPAIAKADRARSHLFEGQESATLDSCHLPYCMSNVFEPGGQKSTNIATSSAVSTRAVLSDQRPSQHEPRGHLTVLTSTALDQQRMPIKEEADGRRRDSSPLSWAATAAASRLPMTTDPSNSLQLFARRGSLVDAKGEGGGVEGTMNGGRGERRSVRFTGPPVGKKDGVHEMKRSYLGERNGRAIHRI